ncbi:MAG: protein-methionine-sulfoxide reductase catalytic subunit MsrP [Alphaproteobacteria bacterium]
MQKQTRSPQVIVPPRWKMSESEATSESVWASRRDVLRGIGVVGAMTAAAPFVAACDSNAQDEVDPSAHLHPAARNEKYTIDRPLANEEDATQYNNFYEFGSSKNIHKKAQKLYLRPWDIEISGLVKNPQTIGIDELFAKVNFEERLYRLRCVEAWAMAIPWTGFPMSDLLAIVEPLDSAKYVKMTTLQDPSVMRNQRAVWYPWPYVEGLTIEEAANELAFLVTGIYGKPLPKQNGSPLRLATPWKYGFKSIKSIVSFEFTEEQPLSFWEDIQASEYGFWANVNPTVPHPRWSQASERIVGSNERRDTLLFNGYEQEVAHLYTNLEEQWGDRLYR